jgi:Flp pilus assembly protein TadD
MLDSAANLTPGGAALGRTWTAGIFALALALRLIYLAQTADSPLVRGTYVDTQWHAEWAQAVARGDLLEDKPFFRAPLYPLFLGLVYALTGSFIAARAVQHVLGAVACVLAARLGAWACGPVIGRAAGLVCAVCAPLMYFENELLTAALEVPLFLAALLAIARAMDQPSAGRWFLAGCLLGLCADCRPNFLAVLPVAALAAWRGGPAPYRQRRWARNVGLLGAGAALAIAPVTAHNLICGGEAVLIATQGGVNFYIGNNPASDGRTAVAPGVYLPRMQAYVDNVWVSSRRVAEQRLGRSLSEREVSKYWMRQGLAFWADQPGAAVGLLLRKVYYFINGFEIESNRSMYLDRQWSWLFAVLLWPGLPALPGGLIWPLALAGAILAPWRDPRLNLLRGAVAAYTLTVVAFFVTARFRVPVLPLAAIFAVRALAELVELGRSRRLGQARPWLAAVVLLVALSNSAFWDVRRVDVARQARILAAVHVQLGEYAPAVMYYREALSREPQHYADHYNLALALRQCGRAGEAVGEMRAAVGLAPDSADARNELGNLLAGGGNLDGAIDQYREAIRLDPGLTMARANLGMTLLDAGRAAEARDCLIEAISQAPHKPTYHLTLGLAWRALGDQSAAAASLARAVELDPQLAAARCALASVLEGLGRLDEARQHRQQAAGLGLPCAEPAHEK